MIAERLLRVSGGGQTKHAIVFVFGSKDHDITGTLAKLWKAKDQNGGLWNRFTLGGQGYFDPFREWKGRVTLPGLSALHWSQWKWPSIEEFSGESDDVTGITSCHFERNLHWNIRNRGNFCCWLAEKLRRADALSPNYREKELKSAGKRSTRSDKNTQLHIFKQFFSGSFHTQYVTYLIAPTCCCCISSTYKQCTTHFYSVCFCYLRSKGKYF